ncbi:MAG: Rieske (2Fe-2S) protein [Desulfobulbaceae bacterium]|nr:Rieske (2Fe-2S) protein [Desulfobulbaceae bacterium]
MKHDKNRRRFCKAGLAGISGLIGAAALGGGAVFLVSPALTNKMDGQWIEVGSKEDFDDGTYSQVVLEFPIQDGWFYGNQKMLAYVRRQGDTVTALSAVCTHLGCNVRFEEERNEFICPCHAGIYDIEGRNIAGPPPKPLDRLPVKIEDDMVFVYNKQEEGGADV